MLNQYLKAHFQFFSPMEVNGCHLILLTYCVQQKKETHTGLEQLKGE